MKRFVIVTFCILAVMLARRPGGFALPTFYFEDGTTFYAAQVVTANPMLVLVPFTHGFLGDSYSLLVARGAALAAWSLPVVLAPYVMNGIGFLAVALSCALFSLARFRLLVSSDALRVILAMLAGTVLDGGEFLGSATNCFWVLVIPILLLCAVPLGTAPRRSALLGFLLALSTPLSALVLPFALRMIAKNGLHSASWFSCSVIAGGAVQLLLGAGVFNSGDGDAVSGVLPTAGQAADSFVNGFVYHVFFPAFLGYDGSRAMMHTGFGIFLAAASCVSIILAVRFVGRTPGISSWWVFYFLFAPLLLTLFRREQWWGLIDAGPNFLWTPPRYYYLPRVVLAFAVLGAIDRLFPRGRSAIVAGVLIFAFSFCSGFVLPERSVMGVPSWTAVAPRVVEWSEAADALLSERQDLPIFEPPDWTVILPAHGLAQFGSERAAEWKGSYLGRGTALGFDATHGSAWTETFVPPGEGLRVRIKVQERCETGSAARIELRLRDSFGAFASDALRESHCDSEGTLEAWLPPGRRRGVRIELRYLGTGTAEMSGLYVE